METALADVPAEAYAALVFTGGEGGKGLPPLPEGCTAREAQGILRVTAPARLSDALIVSMIENGYSLKEMHHEDAV